MAWRSLPWLAMRGLGFSSLSAQEVGTMVV